MRTLIVSCVALTATVCAAAAHAAEAYPTRPVRMIVPYAAGGNADIQARYMAERLGEVLGAQFVVDNRGGANGMIGMEMTARAPADGHTIMLVASGFTVNPSLFSKVPYDTLKDFAPISLVGDTPLLFVAHNGVPAATVKEFIALAKAKPGQFNYGSSGNGSPAHLAGALLETTAGIKLVHVPYKATAALTVETIAGQIQLAFPSLTSVLPHVKAGKLKAYAISVTKRSALAPDIPTMIEAGVPGYETSIWNGILAPARTPPHVVKRLHGAIVQILSSPAAQERYTKVGAEIRYNESPEEFRRFIEAEIVKWGKVIRAAGVTVEQR